MTAANAVVRSTHRIRQVGTAAAIAAGVLLLLKATLIMVTSDTISSTAMGGLFAAGLVLTLVAAAGIAVMQHGWVRQTATYLGVVLATLFYVTMLSDGVGAAVEVFTSEAYITDEAPIALLGVIWLGVGLVMRRHDRR